MFKTHPPLEIVERIDRYQHIVFIHLCGKGGLIECLSANEPRLLQRPLYLVRYRGINYRWAIDRAEMDFLLAHDRALLIQLARRITAIDRFWQFLRIKS
jgi:hypothetical protein